MLKTEPSTTKKLPRQLDQKHRDTPRSGAPGRSSEGRRPAPEHPRPASHACRSRRRACSRWRPPRPAHQGSPGLPARLIYRCGAPHVDAGFSQGRMNFWPGATTRPTLIPGLSLTPSRSAVAVAPRSENAARGLPAAGDFAVFNITAAAVYLETKTSFDPDL